MDAARIPTIRPMNLDKLLIRTGLDARRHSRGHLRGDTSNMVSDCVQAKDYMQADLVIIPSR